MSGPDPAPLRLDPVVPRRAHEHVAEQLRRAILLRAVGPGERLGPERALAVRLDVSHVTIQHALRLLADEGLVTIRRGRRGGAYVRGVPALEPEGTRVAGLRRRAGDLHHALDLRRLVEPGAAAQAAQRRSPEDLVALGERRDAVAAAAGGDDAAFMATDNAFHAALAAATGNPLVLDVVLDLQARLAPALQALPESGPWHARTVTEHAAIAEAVDRRDAPRARAAMEAHVDATQRAVAFLLDAATDLR